MEWNAIDGWVVFFVRASLLRNCLVQGNNIIPWDSPVILGRRVGAGRHWRRTGRMGTNKCGAAAVAASLMALLLVYLHFGIPRRPIAFRLYIRQETSPTETITGPAEHVGYLRDAVRAAYINTRNPTFVAQFLLMNGFGGGWAGHPPCDVWLTHLVDGGMTCAFWQFEQHLMTASEALEMHDLALGCVIDRRPRRMHWLYVKARVLADCSAEALV